MDEYHDPLFNLQCTDDDNRSYWNICNMSLISFSLAVIFIIRPWSLMLKFVPCSICAT